MTLDIVSASRCFAGTQYVYSHDSDVTNCTMKFSAYVPDAAGETPLPVLIYLSGLTCTEENFTVKAAAQRHAAEHGLVVVAPDTSPRGDGVADDDDDDPEQGDELGNERALVGVANSRPGPAKEAGETWVGAQRLEVLR